MAAPLKQLPWSELAEQSVLGGIMLDGTVWQSVAGIVREEHFFSPPHRLIFGRIAALKEADRPVDIVTLSDALKDKGVLELVKGGVAYLAELCESTPAPSTAPAYAQHVLRYALYRQHIAAAGELAEAGFNADADAITNARAKLLMLESPTGSAIINGADIEIRSWHFLCRGWLPSAELTILGGNRKTGKGVLMCDVAAMATGAKPWFDGTRSTPGGSVLWVGWEDDPARTLKPRMRAAGVADARWDVVTPPNNVADVAAWVAQVAPQGVALIVVDPLIQGEDDKSRGDFTTRARRHAEGWARVARNTGAAVVGVMHTVKWGRGKAETSSDLGDMIAGSAQYTAVARAAWIYLRDEDNPTGPRQLVRQYANFDVRPDAMAYRVHGELRDDIMAITRYEADQSGLANARALAEGRRTTHEIDRALLDWLAGAGGSAASTAAKAAVSEELGVSQRHVGRRAAEMIAAGSLEADAGGKGKVRTWRLPPYQG